MTTSLSGMGASRSLTGEKPLLPTYPFISLVTFFVRIENSLELDDYTFTPEMAALLDLYLEPFQQFASKDDLLRAYELSKPVASVISSLAWHQGTIRMDRS